MKLYFGLSQFINPDKLSRYLLNQDKPGHLMESFDPWVKEAQSSLMTLFSGGTGIHQAKRMGFHETDILVMAETTANVKAYVNVEDVQQFLKKLQIHDQNIHLGIQQDGVAIESDGYRDFGKNPSVNHAAVA